jgi:5-methyltetrahydrofolate--homocysteine methyltransferase
MVIIGERLTSGNASVNAAIQTRNPSAIKYLARHQALAGLDYLDVGAAALGPKNEPENLTWLVRTVQEAVGLPLSLDCQNPRALRTVLPLCRRPPILNSFSGMVARPKELLAFIKENAASIAGVVAVCLDTWGKHPSPTERVTMADRFAADLVNAGVPEKAVIFDPVTLPESAGPDAEQASLITVSLLRERFPDSSILCAVSNYSYGLPIRKPANRQFAMRAEDAGADAFLCDALDTTLMVSLQPTLGTGPECHG